MAEASKQLFGQCLKNHGTGVLDPILPMTETHDLAFARHGRIEVIGSTICCSDLIQHGQHILIGPSMERSRQSSNR